MAKGYRRRAKGTVPSPFAICPTLVGLTHLPTERSLFTAHAIVVKLDKRRIKLFILASEKLTLYRFQTSFAKLSNQRCQRELIAQTILFSVHTRG